MDANKWFPRRYFLWKFDVTLYKLYRPFTKSIVIIDFCWKWGHLGNLFVWIPFKKWTENQIQIYRRCKIPVSLCKYSLFPTGPSIALFISESFIFLHSGISSPFCHLLFYHLWRKWRKGTQNFLNVRSPISSLRNLIQRWADHGNTQVKKHKLIPLMYKYLNWYRF